MNISDEQLSAFLDAELPPAAMAAIRDAVALDEKLTERLAELALVDELVAATYRRIDQEPVPEAIHQLLASPQKKSATIIRLPTFTAVKFLPRAMAAGLVMAIGVALILSLNPADNREWLAVASALETSPSGHVRALADGQTLMPRLTFIDDTGDYCRVYRQSFSDGTALDGIGCRRNGHWQPVENSGRQPVADRSSYQTASRAGSVKIDQVLDEMISGDPLDAAAETRVMANHWN
ncbi:MAG: hypothetical protein M0Q95_04820 [Porticoccaceae bacterium]|nr:hypothetical protein [Porticoccaceae bacterium]